MQELYCVINQLLVDLQIQRFSIRCLSLCVAAHYFLINHAHKAFMLTVSGCPPDECKPSIFRFCSRNSFKKQKREFMSYCSFTAERSWEVGPTLDLASRARLSVGFPGFSEVGGVCVLNLCYVLSLGVVGQFPELLNASLQSIITL